MDMKKHHDKWLFIPLGGSGEIGMNLNLYQYKGKWIIVDFGAGFADDFLPGVDMIVPDVQFLAKFKEDIIGIVLTHAHEDHLGAIQYLWPEIKAPVYTTPFTAAFLRAKLQGMPFANEIPINVVECGSQLKLGPFTIDMVALAHSTPEMLALAIRTDLGIVFHTGDWKFDPDPVIGNAADEERLAAYGREGILALVGDSTNVFNPGTSGSEGELAKSLTAIISEQKQMVVVTTFASNVARVETILKAAAKAGRKVVVSGRSLWRIIEAAKSAGYLKDCPEVFEDLIMGQTPRNELLVLCTGCQGELLAATNKIASGIHPKIRMVPGDTIVFSSKIIPGNEKRIFRLFNILTGMGAEVMTEKDHFVHVSGHPSREELIKMYGLIRPQVAIPVHGELVHIHAHAALAKACGVPEALQVADGNVISLAPGKTEIIGSVPAGFLAIDGYSLLAPDSPVMQKRRRIRQDGAFIATIVLNTQGELRADPVLTSPGCLDEASDQDLLAHLRDEIVSLVHTDIRARKKGEDKGLGKSIQNMLKRALQSELGKMPYIDVNIIRC